MESHRDRLIRQLFVLLCITLIYCVDGIDSQSVKGGSATSSSSSSSLESSSKVGGKIGEIGTLSKFRQNIESFQKQQQQQQKPTFAIVKPAIVSKEILPEKPESFSLERPKLSAIQHKEVKSVQQQPFKQVKLENVQFEEHSFYGSVQGVPGVDFPGYKSIPMTQFSCTSVAHDPGMYADEETGCQVYHLCYLGRRESFLCGAGTLFNQAILNCDFWHRVDCSKSSQFHHLNAEFGKSLSEPSGIISRDPPSKGEAIRVKGHGGEGGAAKGGGRVFSSFANSIREEKEHQQLQVPPAGIQKGTSSQLMVHSGAFSSIGKVSSTLTQEQNAQVSPSASLDQQRKPQQQLERTLGSGPILGGPLRFIQSSSGQEDEKKGGKSINEARKVSSDSTLGSFLSQTNHSGNASPLSIKGRTQTRTDSDEWRPYFKSKSSAASASPTPTPSPAPPPLVSSPQTSPAQTTFSPVLDEATSLAPANQEPSFGAKPTTSEASGENSTSLMQTATQSSVTNPATREEIRTTPILATTTTTTVAATTTIEPSPITFAKVEVSNQAETLPTTISPINGIEATTAKDDSPVELTTMVSSLSSTRAPAGILQEYTTNGALFSTSSGASSTVEYESEMSGTTEKA